MRRTLSLAFVLTLALAGACSGDRSATRTAASQRGVAGTDTAIAAEMTPEELGELGARIEKHPGQAKQLLAEKNLDETSFEKQIRKVTESPAASKRYAEAYKKAKS